MSHRWLPLGLTWGAAMTLVLSPLAAWAAPGEAHSKDEAQRLVNEALHREIYGQAAERQRLLEEAAAADPNFAPAQWHRGFIRQGDQWAPLDQAPKAAKQDKRIEQYQTIRAQHEDTVEGHLAVANWCAKKNLVDQERAHLTRVVDLDANHAEARTRLGFRRVGRDWVTDRDLQQARASVQRREQSLAEWRSTLESALRGLETQIDGRRKAAAEKVLAIKDPSAISALEELLCTHSEDAALLAVQVIGGFDTQEATNALARQSVLSPSERVRRQAAKQLRERPLDDYVPTLLAEMYTPVRSMTQLAPAPGGRLVFRHAFLREGQGERQQVVLDTAYRRLALNGGSRRESTRRALSDAQLTAASREMAVGQQNQMTQEVNSRICQTLNYTTDQNIAAIPENWWSWWNERNEVFVESEKPLETIYATRETEVVDRVGGEFTKDCLIAGTPVWTAMGAVPVEQVAVGDLVLSQDPRTGELAYKPVFRTTVRPRSRLIRIQAGEDTFQTSGGHLFWVAGEGWVKARELQSGHELHGATGPVRVLDVQEGEEAETYNLVVADFNTYFVGAGRVLSHDNTVRQPVSVIVPGLAQ